MSKFAAIGVAITMIIIVICYSLLVIIPPGYVGVAVNMLGNEKGVEENELSVGAHLVSPWKMIYKFPIFEQNHLWERAQKFTFQTSEGLVVEADVGITYHLEPNKIHLLFAKYRRGMDEITDVFIRNFIRDAINRYASKLKIEDLYGSAKEKFFDDVQKVVRNDLQNLGIIVERIYLVGNFLFPDGVVKALNSKIEAVQRAQQRENELRESEAEAKKLMAKAHGEAESALIRAKAQAESNRIVAESLTSELIYWQAVQKWDGELPTALSSQGFMMPLTLGEGLSKSSTENKGLLNIMPKQPNESSPKK
jgi:regulator of protease activity HflC (stomatin/prohibitin superfamily)